MPISTLSYVTLSSIVERSATKEKHRCKSLMWQALNDASVNTIHAYRRTERCTSEAQRH